MPVEWHCRHCRLRPASWCLSPLSLPPPRRTKSLPQRARDVLTSRQRVRRHQPSQPVPPPEIGRTRKTALLGSTGQPRRQELQGALHQTVPRAVDRPITPNESRVSCAARHRTGSSADIEAAVSSCVAVPPSPRTRDHDLGIDAAVSRPRRSRPRARDHGLGINAAVSRPQNAASRLRSSE